MKVHKFLGTRSIGMWFKMIFGFCEVKGCRKRSCCTITFSKGNDLKKEVICKKHICEEHLVGLAIFHKDV